MKNLRYIPFLFILFSFAFSQAQDMAPQCTNDQEGYSISQVSPPKYPTLTEAVVGFWYPANTYPSLPAITYFQESVWLGDTLYVHTPPAGAATNIIIKYTLGGAWSDGIPLPASLTGGSMTACNGKMYYIGGSLTAINGTAANTVYEYNPATLTWTPKSPMPLALTGHSSVCWGDSVIFVVGGPYTGAGTNLNVYYYRVNSDTWGTITNSLPVGQGRRTFALGLVGGNKIIMAGGFNTVFLKNMFIGTIGADASQITWVAGPDVPIAYTGLSRPGAAYYQDYFFFVCGERGGPGGYCDTTQVFNVSSNNWVGVMDNIPFKRSNIFNGVATKVVNDTIKLFIPGGYGNVVSGGTGAGTNVFDVGAFTAYIIPVELTSFTASANDYNVALNWITATETNNKGFEVQRKVQGGQFNSIAFLEGAGTTTQTQSYSYSDIGLIPGNYSYRLRQIDFDGTTEFSKVVEVKIVAPTVFSLEQNYPNPFNPSTAINFSVPVDSKVDVKIFNLLGQEIASIFSGNVSAGLQSINFDASSYASGMYIYKMEANGIDGTNFTAIKKMILTK